MRAAGVTIVGGKKTARRRPVARPAVGAA